MRVEWLPYSASALVAGGVALAASALLMPSAENSAGSLQIVRQEDGAWLAVAVLFFAASVLLTLGLPAVLTLVAQRSAVLGMISLGVFAVGCIGTSGYAMLLVFFRAGVLTGVIRQQGLDALTQDYGLNGFLIGWIASFYLGELLLAITLLRSRTTPRWIPLLLVLHVATLPLGQVVAAEVQSLTVLLVTVAVAGLGITANNLDLTPLGPGRASRRGPQRASVSEGRPGG